MGNGKFFLLVPFCTRTGDEETETLWERICLIQVVDSKKVLRTAPLLVTKTLIFPEREKRKKREKKLHFYSNAKTVFPVNELSNFITSQKIYKI